MLRRLVILLPLIAAVGLLIPVATVASTQNSFCDIQTETLCGDVLVEEFAFNQCTGEFVQLSGTVHVAVFVGDNQMFTHTNWQNVTGIGVSSQTIYQANEATRDYVNPRPSGNPIAVGTDDERELVSKAGLDNFIFRLRVDIVVDTDNPENSKIKREESGFKCVG